MSYYRTRNWFPSGILPTSHGWLYGGLPQTPKGDPSIYDDNCYDGALGSLEGTGRAFLGVFNPSNWNSEAMGRLYELGPLGQAEGHGKGAYYATAGSLAFAGAAATAAGGVMIAESAGAGTALYNSGRITGSGGQYFRFGWGKHNFGDGMQRVLRAAGNITKKVKWHCDILKGPKIGGPK